MSRVGTEFHPPQDGDFGIVDMNVLYHPLFGFVSGRQWRNYDVVNIILTVNQTTTSV
jgi:hypothetical protein